MTNTANSTWNWNVADAAASLHLELERRLTLPRSLHLELELISQPDPTRSARRVAPNFRVPDPTPNRVARPRTRSHETSAPSPHPKWTFNFPLRTILDSHEPRRAPVMSPGRF